MENVMDMQERIEQVVRLRITGQSLASCINPTLLLAWSSANLMRGDDLYVGSRHCDILSIAESSP